MGEVPLYMSGNIFGYISVNFGRQKQQEGFYDSWGHPQLAGYRVTSLTGKNLPRGPYRRPMARALRGS